MYKTHNFRNRPIIQPHIGRSNFSSTMSPTKSTKNIQQLNEKLEDQLGEICDLKKQILEERSYREELEKKINEMDSFIKEYGLYSYRERHPECLEFINGLTDVNKFRTQITLLNDKVHARTQRLCKSDSNMMRVVDEKPMKLELLKNGFAINNNYDNIRKYSNPINANFLYMLSVGAFPDEIKSKYPEGIRIELIDSTYLPDQTVGGKQISNEKESILEPLTSPEPLGEGNGMLKIVLPSGNKQMVKISKDTKIKEILDLLESTIGFAGYELFSTITNKKINESESVNEIKLFPHGVLNARRNNA